MSLFTSNSRYRHTVVPLLIFLILFGILNLIVALLPDGSFMLSFRNHLYVAEKNGKQAKVILFGDSRATGFHPIMFKEPILSLAAPNTTVLYSYFLFREIIGRRLTSPQVMIICLGANNYNENGIFAKRDFGVRVLAGFPDLAGFAAVKGGFNYALDGFFAKIFPLYAYRMEIRTPAELIPMLKALKNGPALLPGEGQAPDLIHAVPPQRNEIDDRNYLEIYRRSVLNNYRISSLHLHYLEKLISEAEAGGLKVILVELPMENMMLSLHEKLSDRIFDPVISRLAARKRVTLLDLRRRNDNEFNDLNHLSAGGLKKVADENLEPAIAAALREGKP